MTFRTIVSGVANPMGSCFDGQGTNFAVFSAHAERIELCLFDPSGTTEIARLQLPERKGAIWHGYVADLGPGAVYGYRAYGPYAPEQGHRFNPNKLLLDPYARQVLGGWSNHDATFGYDRNSPDGDMSFSKTDSAPYVAKSVVTERDGGLPVRPLQPSQPGRDVIYEAHPKGLTMTHPDVPEVLRGTYDALAQPAIVSHLTDLGVSAIELLPVHGFLDDDFLLKRGLTNYWGYNSLAFFAPEARYFGPGGAQGFRDMVSGYHDAGIEVLLDVVYNHSGEGDHLGPTLCFRGLDNASYYRLLPGDPRLNVNDTGCGNTFNLSNPHVLRLVMDSLRHWVQEMGVDGFRFDLGTTLGREVHGFDQNSGFFDALRQDPVLSGVRLIAEPWDIGVGGYQLGAFTPEFAEWNDMFRDGSRRFWRGDTDSAQSLAGLLLGTSEKFDHSGRRADTSVNFVSAHDGFTLADTTRYVEKHNLANTENNQDGHNGNFSDNFGIEGVSEDPEIQSARALRQRNLLATLLVSQGTPMLLSGDEFGNSQDGNNNAYCQDNEIGWLDWPGADGTLLAFTQKLLAFRTANPVLRQRHFLHGQLRAQDGLPDVIWQGFDGSKVDWTDPDLDCFCLVLRGSAGARADLSPTGVVCLAFNRSGTTRPLVLPSTGVKAAWKFGFDTSRPEARDRERPAGAKVSVAPNAVMAFARPPEAAS
ncbi:MAG: glycogen debranching protein GlgX [Pseudomonadota bacterium]